MLTIRAAAQLLANATSVASLHPIATLLGATHAPRPLDGALTRQLGLDTLTTHAHISAGAGALRLLLAELAPPCEPGAGFDPRERTRRIGAALLRNAPTQWWVLITVDPGQTVCITTVTPSPGGADLAVLRVEPDRVLDSDAETLRALAGVTEQDDLLRHARFSDILRREALGLRFYRALESAVTRLADSVDGRGADTVPPAERRELALLCASRCLFLAFLEAKGWLDARRDFLLHHTLRMLEDGGRLHQRLLRPLFFGTLNTPTRRRAPEARKFGAVPFLNGGLFSPTPLERRHRTRHFSDDAITYLVTAVIDRYRFTAREDSTSWSEAAVDPEMLGRAFEGLMAADERRRSGSFYTPPHLVSDTVRHALRIVFADMPALLPLLDMAPAAPMGTAIDDAQRSTLRDRLTQQRILDPACGSGAFLVHMLERLDALLAALGDSRDSHTRRRDLLARSIFGVDRNPMAVWLCELRLWLSVVIECRESRVESIPPLPNLDHHIRVGDSLAGGAFAFAPPSARTLTRLRDRYVRASGAHKQRLATSLEREERGRAIAEVARRQAAVARERHALLITLRGRDLFGERRRAIRTERARLGELRESARDLRAQHERLALGSALPFRYAAMFADVAANGGFTIVVGNPPWVRPHALPARERQWLREEFRTMRDAAWRQGAARAGAGAGFAAQSDLAVAFIERSIELLAPGGVLALLVPAKLWRTLSGGGIRRMLLEQTNVRALHDWSDAEAQFDAATYPSLVVATRRIPDLPLAPAPVHVAVTRKHTTCFEQLATDLSLHGEDGAPWLFLPPDARRAFDLLHRAGPPLAGTTLGRPLLGVKCGCNAAFVVHAHEHDDHSATITTLDADPIQGVVERTLLRPALRGESVGKDGHTVAARATQHHHPNGDLRILWTHGADGAPLPMLPPATARWLAQWRPRLHARRDARNGQRWWSLFRTEAAAADTPRVVWADIGRRLRSTVLDAGDPTVPLNSCYVVRTPTIDSAWALHALLSSTVAAAWLDSLAEPARGGFRRYLGWTVATLPTPRDWPAAVAALAPLGRLVGTAALDQQALDRAVLHAFGLITHDFSPLLEWYRQENAHHAQ